MKTRIPGLLLVTLLSGCATAPDAVPTGHQGRLVLRQALAIPPDAATVRLQHGRIVPNNAVQEQDPFCIFEIDTVAPGEQTVRPGAFTITGVSRSVETFSGMPVGFHPLLFRRVALGDSDGGPSQIYYKTTFRLSAPDQPVRALACMSNQYMPGNPIMRHLTLAEIRQALGTWFNLEFPA